MTPQQKLTAYRTIVTREILRFGRIWIQTVLPPMITTALYFIIFGNLIGSQIGDMDGVRYMEFIIPGLIMMAVITNSYSNVVSSFFSSKFQRHIEEMLVSPVPAYVIVLGFVSGGVARGITCGIAVTAVSLFFSPLNIHSLPVMLSMILLTMPIFWPIIAGMDFGMDPEDVKIWFGIIALIVVETGLITPPVGMNVFVINSMARDIPIAQTFKGVAPFILSDIVRVLLLLAFPGLTLVLVRLIGT